MRARPVKDTARGRPYRSPSQIETMDVVELAQALRGAIKSGALSRARVKGAHRAPLSQVVGQWGESDKDADAAHKARLAKLRKDLSASVKGLLGPGRHGSRSPRSLNLTRESHLPTPIPPALHKAMHDALVRGGDGGDDVFPSARSLLSAVMLSLEQQRRKRGFLLSLRGVSLSLSRAASVTQSSPPPLLNNAQQRKPSASARPRLCTGGRGCCAFPRLGALLLGFLS